jgi:hypothetical protein
LIRKNSHNHSSDDVPIQALSGLVSLQGLTMSTIDHALKEIIPEDLLLEPLETDSDAVRTEVSDDIPLASNLVGQEITRTFSHASSTLEGGLARVNIPALDVAGQGYSALVGTIEGASASEGATEDNPSPEGVVKDNLAPKGAELGSSLGASMDVHARSPPVQSEEPVVTILPLLLLVQSL